MVGLLYISDLVGCPFIERYIYALKKNNIDYKIIIWNREAKENKIVDNGNVIEFGFKQDTRMKKSAKILGFLKYAKFLRKTIKQYKFDKLIVLCTLTGILVGDLLTKKYKNKFIFDIRDASYEYISLFKKYEKKIIDASSFTTISSKGFLELLPESSKYVFCPNLREGDIQMIVGKSFVFKKKQYGETLNFVYAGAIRQYENVLRIIDALANDPRFEVFYHGAGDEGFKDVVDYVNKKKFTNIHFTGKYANDQKIKLLSNADLLNNFYECLYDMKYANTNKYLDALLYHIPLVSNSETHDGKLSIEENIGISFEKTIDADKLYEAYFNIDEHNFNVACNNILKVNMAANKKIEEKIFCFLES